jgi:uncharacterized membrane protein
MRTSGWVKLALTALLVASLAGCGRSPEKATDLLGKPKAFVGYTALGFGLYMLINGIVYGRYIQLH